MSHSPKLLILDEPIWGLDSMARREVLEVLGEVAGRGVGVVLTSRVADDIEGIVSSWLLLESGRNPETAPAGRPRNHLKIIQTEGRNHNAQRVSGYRPPSLL